MNAILPTLPNLASPNAAPASGTAGAETELGFADALQQARQPAPAPTSQGTGRPVEGRPSRGEPAPRDETTRAAAAAGDRPADEATDAAAEPAPEAAIDAQAADPAAGAATGLPVWLEVALARPVRTDRVGDAARAEDPLEPAAAQARAGGAAGRAADPLAATPGSAATAVPGAGRGDPEVAAEGIGFTAALQQATGSEPQRLPATPEPAPPLPGAAAPAGPAGRAPEAAPLPERSVAAPLHGPEFAPALGAQLNLMVKDGVTEARLHLNPAEMGPITVQIQIEGRTARVEMAAEQAATRQVLEQSMPVLAGALRDNGLTLTGGGVFEQARDPRQGDDGDRTATARQGTEAAADGAEAASAGTGLRPAALPQGLVDLYA